MPRRPPTFARLLVEHRRRLGLSLADLAERMGDGLQEWGLSWLTRTRLSDWERGERTPSAMTQRVVLDWLERQKARP